MSKAGEEILQGMREALAHATGEETGAIVHTFEAPDVSAVREKTKLSQERFAATFGMSLGTLRGWEQGRRRPDGPARVLLTLIDRDPVTMLKTLRISAAKEPKRAPKRERKRAAASAR